MQSASLHSPHLPLALPPSIPLPLRQPLPPSPFLSLFSMCRARGHYLSHSGHVRWNGGVCSELKHRELWGIVTSSGSLGNNTMQQSSCQWENLSLTLSTPSNTTCCVVLMVILHIGLCCVLCLSTNTQYWHFRLRLCFRVQRRTSGVQWIYTISTHTGINRKTKERSKGKASLCCLCFSLWRFFSMFEHLHLAHVWAEREATDNVSLFYHIHIYITWPFLALNKILWPYSRNRWGFVHRKEPICWSSYWPWLQNPRYTDELFMTARCQKSWNIYLSKLAGLLQGGRT